LYKIHDLSKFELPENYILALEKSIDACEKEFGNNIRLLLLS
jgi:hypothetical protein